MTRWLRSNNNVDSSKPVVEEPREQTKRQQYSDPDPIRDLNDAVQGGLIDIMTPSGDSQGGFGDS